MSLPKNILFTIAIDKYQSDVWPNLANAVLDAKKVSQILTEKYSFEVYHGSLTNHQATRDNIYSAFISLKQFIDPSDNLIILFTGHGQMNLQTYRGYWVPMDGTRNPSTLIENAVIKDFIEDIDAKHIWLISDSCFSGTFLTRTRGIIEEKEYTKLTFNKSRWMLASGSEERVSDGQPGQHSPFAKYLIRFLENNTNAFCSVNEIIKYVTTLTNNNSKQTSRGAFIDNIGHEDGEMVLKLNEKFIIQNINTTRGIPNTPSLKLEIKNTDDNENKLSTGKEILLIKSFIKDYDFMIIENFRFEDDGKKKIKFKENKVLFQGVKKEDDFILVQRFATWIGLKRYFDNNQEAFKAKSIVAINAVKEIENVEDTAYALAQAEYLKELLEFNKDPMSCLHCGEKISTNDCFFIEIDELELKDKVGNVHKDCLRPADRIIGESGYKDLKKSNLLNFDYSKWADLLLKGQGQIRAIKKKFPNNIIPLPVISWNPLNNINTGKYCIRQYYEDGSYSFMMLGKNIHRFSKEEINVEVEKFNKQIKKFKEQGDPICMIVETKMNGSYKLLNKLKLPEQTIVNASHFEKATYSIQLEENQTDINNDYTPIGLVCFPETDDLVKIGNHVLLITNPLEFDIHYQNWSEIVQNLKGCKIKILESDFELDAYLQHFYRENLIPVIDPIFDKKTNSLISGYEIRSMESIISKANNKPKYWKKGDKVKIVFPNVVTDKYATGILLTDEFIDENGESFAVFQPIENGKKLKDLQYAIPTRLFQKIK
ncbi:caspase family protein [Flavobacterium undicola]|uniref:caspase family protein n=1 Tax=Flavobacterium undicola TaxID=1932779 RepID=UPI001376BB7E|nr:caspase family protein [Flavobacterium undicola]MBA0885144.1 caspase family protein [Flavobacterium undicola]